MLGALPSVNELLLSVTPRRPTRVCPKFARDLSQTDGVVSALFPRLSYMHMVR